METDGRGALGKSGLIASLVVSLGLVACSTPTPPPLAQRDTVGVRVIQEAQQSQPVGTRMPQADGDLCKAGELQWLVGRPKSEIPVPVDVVNRRVACTTCPLTEDYSAYRLNILFNASSDVVEHVRCG